MTSTSSAARSRSRFPRSFDVVALGALIAVAAFLFSLSLRDQTNYDEGVYLASLDALRHGQQLGRDVFASQPPGFYLLLRLIAVFAGRSIEGIRIGFLVVALIGVAAAYFLGREVAGRAGGVAVAALLIAAPPYSADAPHIEADPPSIAFALVALAIAARAFRRNRIWGPAAAGAVAAAAVSIKLLALPVVVPLAVLAWRRRLRARSTAAVVSGALFVAAAFAIAFAGVLPELWRDAVVFHWDSRSVTLGQSAGARIVDYFGLRTPTTWAAAAGIVTALVARRQLALWLWLAAALGFLLMQKPLLDHHFVLVAAALAAAAGASLASAPWRLPIAAAGVIAVAGWFQDYRQIERSNHPEPPEIRQAARIVSAATRPGELVASDVPIVPYLAGRQQPGDLVDTSAVRFASHSLTARDVASARVRVYVAGREFSHHPATIRGLRLVRKVGMIRILVRP